MLLCGLSTVRTCVLYAEVREARNSQTLSLAQRGESLITMYKTRSNLLCIYISESLLPVYHWLRKWIVIKLETQLWCSDYNDKFNVIVLKWMKWNICKFTSKGQYALKSLNFLCDIIKIHTVKFVKS